MKQVKPKRFEKKIVTKTDLKKEKKYGTSKLELDFAREFLDKNNIVYIYQYEAKEIGRFFDFAITSYRDKSYLMENKDAKDIGDFINIGSGFDMPISEIVEKIKEAVGFSGNLVYDTTKPDGTMLKLMDVSKINALGWEAKTKLEDGLKIAYGDFLSRKLV